MWFPLKVLLCTHCWLAQTEDFVDHDQLFDDEYAYFSCYSESWLKHSETYMGLMSGRFSLSETSMVVEVAANDGYLLQFAQKLNIPCLGIEPTASTAAAARSKGIPIVEDFFGISLANRLKQEGHSADLMVANNVLAHVPDINDFVSGFSILLKDDGVVTFEFPHLLSLISNNLFDIIYHEHFSYISLTALKNIFPKNGLTIFDVEDLKTQGGSLRVYAQRSDAGTHPIYESVTNYLKKEASAGLATIECYKDFQARTIEIKDNFLEFLIDAKRKGKSVAAYGAAAKGNTIINYAGIRSDSISFVVDRNPSKLGKYLPGSRIPIVSESHLIDSKPDYVVLLPWNLKQELEQQLSYVSEWGGKLVTVVPTISIV